MNLYLCQVAQSVFACHSTEDDQHELVSVICYASKPEDMKVQTFFYHLKELNDYIDWLPGEEPALTDAQLNLAFYNRMPGSWCMHYAISGWLAHTTTRAELLHYFCVQEHEQVAKDKISKKKFNCHKEFKNGLSCAQQQFKEHMKNKQGVPAS
jgi:hypothetical protein